MFLAHLAYLLSQKNTVCGSAQLVTCVDLFVDGKLISNPRHSLGENLSQQHSYGNHREDPDYTVDLKHIRNLERLLRGSADLNFSIGRERLSHVGILQGSRLMKIPTEIQEEARKNRRIDSWISPETGRTYVITYEHGKLYVKAIDQKDTDPYRVAVFVKIQGVPLNHIFQELVSQYHRS